MKIQQKIINNLKIIDFGINGVGIAKNQEGKIIIVYQAIPGDIVDVLVFNIKKKYLEAKIINFLHFSIFRVNPKCKLFEICGGCKWQHLSYQEQLNYKQNRVVENIKRIAGIEFNFFVFPILAAKNIFYYRNKVEFSFLNREDNQGINKHTEKIINIKVLGFHVFKKWDKIIHIEECFLIKKVANQIHNFVYNYSINNHLSFYNLQNRRGLLRKLMIRCNQKDNFMLVFQLGRCSNLVNDLFFSLVKKFPQITNLGYVINNNLYNVWNKLPIYWYKGRGFLIEKIENFFFKIYAKSFFQTNTEQTIFLYQIVRKFAQLTGKEIVFDFYSGIGTISQFISFQAKKVIGIDSVFESIQSANEFVKQNNVYNCEFICSDLKYIFSCNLIEQYGFPDVIILDPPREGLHQQVLDFILNFSFVKKIIYISCNPSTQCRDLKILKCQYKLIQLQVIDMFPQTDNIESVMLLERI